MNIWGKGGLYEQSVQQKLDANLPERGMQVKEQNAQTLQTESAGRTDIANFRADTERARFLKPDEMGDLGLGLRGLSRATSGNILDNDGNLIGVRGSKVNENNAGLRGGYQPLGTELVQRSNRALYSSGRSEGAAREGMTVSERFGTFEDEVDNSTVLMNKGGKVPCMNKGGMVPPGMRKNQKIQMPGPIGDEANDTGKDTVDAKVRPGEYLLNPETVAHMGGGDYDQGVRMLNRTVMEATGKAPGAEYKDGTMYAADGAWVVGEDGIVRPSRPFANNPLSAEGAAYEQARTANEPKYTRVDTRFTGPEQPSNTPKSGGRFNIFEESATNPKVSDTKTAKTAVKAGKAAAKIPLKAAGYVGRKVPQIAALAETGDVIDVATDPNMTKMDVAEQTARSAGKFGAAGAGALAGGKVGAGLGSFLGPVGTVAGGTAGAIIGGGGAYFLSDKAMDYATGEDDPSARSYGSVKRGLNAAGIPGYENPNATPATPANTGLRRADPSPALLNASSPEAYVNDVYNDVMPDMQNQTVVSPQGGEATTMNLSEADVPMQRASEQEMLANYLRLNSQEASRFTDPVTGREGVNAGNLRDIQPGMQYAGKYGGQDVIVTKGAKGEPVFTGLRSPEEVAASTARSQQGQPAPNTLQMMEERYQSLLDGTAPDADFASRSGETKALGDQIARMYASRQNATGSPATPGEKMEDLQAALGPMFTKPTFDSEGNMTGTEADTEMVGEFASYLASKGVDVSTAPFDALTAEARKWEQRRQLADNVTGSLRDTDYESFYGPSGAGFGSVGNRREATWRDLRVPFSDRSFGGDAYSGLDLFSGDVFGDAREINTPSGKVVIPESDATRGVNLREFEALRRSGQ